MKIKKFTEINEYHESEIIDDEYSDDEYDEVECPDCDGTGDIDDEECERCEGSGRVYRPDDIPPDDEYDDEYEDEYDESEGDDEEKHGHYEPLDNGEKGDFYFDDYDEDEEKIQNENIDNFTARYYDNYDDEDEDDSFEENSTDELRKIQMFEDFQDYYTYECSGSPKPTFKTKAEFDEFMSECGFKHTTLTKKTDMLIVESKDFGSLKCQKAQRYNIPIYTYREAKKKVKEMSDDIKNFNL